MALAVVGAFVAALVATGLCAFCLALALAFGPEDPRPEWWGGIAFYVVFFSLVGWGIVRNGQRARQAGGAV